MTRRFLPAGRIVALFLIAAGALAVPVAPARAQPASDPVVATVGDEEIRRSEVMQAMELYGQDLKNLPPEERFALVLDRVIDSRLVTRAAREADLDQSPEFERQMRLLEDRVLQQLLIAELLEQATTDEALREHYDATYAGGKGAPEVRARHILVKDKAKAEEIIKALEGGADFAYLAEKESIDSSAKRGGDLGFFSREDMVEPFADAAFALKPGTYTKEPVESQFGWHVIKVEETRTQPAPSFESIRPELEQRASRAAVGDLLERLRDEVEIEITDAAKPPPTNQ